MKTSSKITYSHEWISQLENPLHWTLYWHQLNLVLNKSPVSKDENIVEVGIGSGLVSMYLKRKGYKVTTVDIDKNKNPDIVANIIEDKIPDADTYLAFEILEHIPFTEAQKFLKKLSDKKIRRIIFSVPHAYKTYLFSQIWLPYFGNKTIHMGRKRNYINTKNHHWELGINGITLNSIEKSLTDVGYALGYTYRYRNHQFFIANLLDK